MATITITVTVAGGKFVLDGVSQATYSATPGNTYKFDQSDGTNGTHPLRLSTTSDGTHNSGSAYTDGVTTNGTPGSAGAYTQIVVTATTVQALYYYCSNHSGMGGSFNTGSSGTVQYQDRAGFAVQNKTSNPTNATVGDFYYNSTTGQFKTVGTGVGSWATGGDLNNGRGQIGSASISGNTTGFGFGGWDGPASAVRSYAEQSDGTSWAEGPDMPGTARLAGAVGSNTSCISAGGSTGPSGAPIAPGAFEWNGSSWSNGGSMNNARRNSTGAGISESAGRVFGGGDNPGPAQNFNEGYNGTAFTTDTALNTARIGLMGFGTKDDAIGAGGDTLVVEQWNGSSWTEITEILQKTDNSGGRCGSSSSDGMIFTRDQSSSMITQKWDGTSWTELADLSVSRYNNSGGGPSSSNALSFGGYGPPSPQMVSTEEWEVPDFAIKTVTTS